MVEHEPDRLVELAGVPVGRDLEMPDAERPDDVDGVTDEATGDATAHVIVVDEEIVELDGPVDDPVLAKPTTAACTTRAASTPMGYVGAGSTPWPDHVVMQNLIQPSLQGSTSANPSPSEVRADAASSRVSSELEGLRKPNPA